MKRILCALLALIALAACLPSAGALEYTVPVETASGAVCVYNLDTDTVVYEKNADERLVPSSLTKMITALVVLDSCDDPYNTTVTVPSNLWSYFPANSNASTSGLRLQETLTVTDALYCLLVRSGCDAAVTLACSFGGYNEFIEKMNRKAAELGCTNTNFVNPHGLHDESQYTSANDMVKIAAELMRSELLTRICGTARHTLPKTNKNNSRVLVSTNYMLNSSSEYHVAWIKGLKTGYTEAGGRSLAVAATKNSNSYIAVFLSAPTRSNGKWENGVSTYNDAFAMLDWCFKNLSVKDAVNQKTAVATVEVTAAKDTDSVVLYAKSRLTLLVQSGAPVEYTYEPDIPKSIKAPVEEGQIVGTARVYANGDLLGTVELVARNAVEYSAFVAAMDAITAAISSTAGMVTLGVVFLSIIFYVIVVRVIAPNTRKNRKRK